MNILELVLTGGFTMYPLILFSVVVWIIGIQKFFELVLFTKNYNAFYKELQQSVASRNLEEIRWGFRNAGQFLNKNYNMLFEEVVSSKSSNKEEIKESLGRRLAETQAQLKKRLWILGTIGSSAPFVGLSGTVVGIMSSFKSIGENGKSGFAVVSAGISEALVVTAAGIIIAVVALMIYNYLQNKVNQTFLDFKIKIEDLIQKVNKCKQNQSGDLVTPGTKSSSSHHQAQAQGRTYDGPPKFSYPAGE